jgi:hypothetical protein
LAVIRIDSIVKALGACHHPREFFGRGRSELARLSMLRVSRAVLVSIALVVAVIAAACGGSGGSGFQIGANEDGGDASSFVDGGDFNRDGARCTRTCQPGDCGPLSDGCGGLVDCGGCTGPAYCGGGGPSKCGTANCTKKTCAELGATCGQQGDGCGGLIDCGTCDAPATCGGGGTPNVCGGGTPPCTPKKCSDMGINCGPAADGCGGLVNCGTCTAPDSCGGGGQFSVCGTSNGPCVKKTCANYPNTCGQQPDGCGGLTTNCGTCTLPQICGGGGVPSKCGGGPPPCTKKTCANYPNTCGQQPDGCGGLTTNCGTCSPPAICGGGGVPSKCGGGVSCTKKTCADYPTGTCGQVSDGCGGLTSDCGGCSTPAICGGGGVPSQCGGGGGTSCVNLACKQVTCSGSATSSISGYVYDPAGNNPLYNVFVYIPNGTPTAFVDGATCDKCADALSGFPLVTTITDTSGHFTLTNVPVGTSIPVVIQTGKWRRQIKVDTAACVDVPIAKSLTRLPKSQSEGDMPRIALATGGYDSIECLLRKIGIADTEFTNPTGNGRVNLYRGLPTTGQIKSAGQYSNAFGGASFPNATTLWGSASSLKRYDVTILGCEGDTYGVTKGSTALKAMFDYVNGGGRVFASHYHHYWLSANTNGTGTGAWGTLASWKYPSVGMLATNGSATVPEKVITSFTKGAAMAEWLYNVTASPSVGNISIFDTKDSVASYDTSRMLDWIYAPAGLDYPSLASLSNVPQYLSFNAPLQTASADQCGRFVFSDIHVSTSDRGTQFPTECVSSGMTAQEKALEFMLFDLSSRVCDDTQPPPPPTCTKRTCQDQGIACGPASDGCGGVIANCGDCQSPLVCSTGGKCAGSSCVATTCAALGVQCGQWPDGCGGTLDCKSCTPPATCGGGGIPGKCGGSTCTAATCTSLGVECGSWANGCGSTLNCGTCTLPQTCGGGGVPGKCGGTSCNAKTCAQLGVSCGLSGNGCGGTIDCGPCPDGGTSCTPLTCGGRCGPQGDGCGNVLACPACDGGACVPTTCGGAGAECGDYPDGCGGLLHCGTCTNGTCGGGGVPNKCGSPK